MSVTLASDQIGSHYLEISQDKDNQSYKVGIHENAGPYYITQDVKYYGSMEQAKRRYNALRKQVVAGKW